MTRSPRNGGPPVRRHSNRGAYHGETITIPDVLLRLEEAAGAGGWTIRELTLQGSHPVWHFARPTLPSRRPSRRIYLSAGIHGDEPAGTLAALQLLRDNAWPADVDIDLFPCLNPFGFEHNRREGPEGIDLNRDYRDPRTHVVRTHRAWLDSQTDFEVALLLHEDWEADGFYLYELSAGDRRSLAANVIRGVMPFCPILQASQADDWPAVEGVVRPAVDPLERPEWPEAVYLFQERTDLTYTFEAPSDFELSVRVAALVAAARTALDHL